jgi:hypothetical protein
MFPRSFFSLVFFAENYFPGPAGIVGRPIYINVSLSSYSIPVNRWA